MKNKNTPRPNLYIRHVRFHGLRKGCKTSLLKKHLLNGSLYITPMQNYNLCTLQNGYMYTFIKVGAYGRTQPQDELYKFQA